MVTLPPTRTPVEDDPPVEQSLAEEEDEEDVRLRGVPSFELLWGAENRIWYMYHFCFWGRGMLLSGSSLVWVTNRMVSRSPCMTIQATYV